MFIVALGKACGIHYKQISFIENGKSNCHILTLKSIADVLKVDVKDFL